MMRSVIAAVVSLFARIGHPQQKRHPASGIRHPASGIRHPASGIRHPALIIPQNQYVSDKWKRGVSRFFFAGTNNAIFGAPALRLRVLMCSAKRACAGVLCVWILSSGIAQAQNFVLGLNLSCDSPIVNNPAATSTINAYSFHEKYNGDLMSPWIDAHVTYKCTASKNEATYYSWEVSLSGYKFVKTSSVTRLGDVTVGGQQYSVYGHSSMPHAGLIFSVKKDNGSWQPLIGTSATQNIAGIAATKKLVNSQSNQLYLDLEKIVIIQFAVVKYGNQYPAAGAASSSLKMTYAMGKFGFSQAKTTHRASASQGGTHSKTVNWGSGKIEVAISPVVQYTNYASCSTPKVSVGNPITLDDVLTTNLGSVGSVAKEKTFKLNFSGCKNINSIKYSIATTSQTSAIELANGLLGQFGTAGGIKIQLRRKNSGQTVWVPVSLGGTQTYTENSSGTSKSLDFAVRYYRTGTLNPGTVKGAMIFKINYQ